jgi:YVTN family beta-propeller protein
VVSVGDLPVALVVNPVTNKIYVVNEGDETVTVIDGVDNSTTTVGVGDDPRSLAVNPVTNTIYVANFGSHDVTVIDGTNDTVIATVTAGLFPAAVAVNPATGKVYVANSGGDDDVTVITPARTEAIPLLTIIAPLAGDTTWLAQPTFSLSAGAFTSISSPLPARHIYYQVDTWIGPWLQASPAGNSGSGQTPTLLPGTHLLFAFAADGEEATSINTGQGSSPIIGRISAYHFLMNGHRTNVPLVLKGY